MYESIEYSIPYVLLLLFISISYFLDKKSQASYNKIIIVILIFLFGLRGFLLTDFINYFPLYGDIPSFSLQILPNLNDYTAEFGGVEYGYALLTSVFKLFTGDYFIFCFVTFCIEILIINHLFRRYSSSTPLSWIFFITFGGLLIICNLYRNVIAIIIFLCAIQYIIKKEPIKYFLLISLACCFHVSSVIYLFIYFFIDKKWNRTFVFILFVIITFLFIIGIHPTTYIADSLNFGEELRLINKLKGYSENSETSVSLSFGQIERMLSFIICLCLYNKIYKLGRYNIIFANSLFLYYFFITAFADIYVLAERFSYLFIFSYWFIFPNIIKNLIKAANQKIVLSIVLLFCVFKTVLTTKTAIWKYDNVIFGIESYEVRQSRYESNKK